MDERDMRNEASLVRHSLAELTDAVHFLQRSMARSDGPVQEALVGLQRCVSETERQWAGAEASSALRTEVTGLCRGVAGLTKTVAGVWESYAELQRMAEVQRRLSLPVSVEVPGAVVHAWSTPMAACTGHWWTAQALSDERGLVALGHAGRDGAPEALVGGVIRGACDLAATGMGPGLQPQGLLRMLHRVIRDAVGEAFLSAAVALTLSPELGEVSLANAGHSPLLFRTHGQWGSIRSEQEPPLGSPGEFRHEELVLPVRSGDCIVTFTGGPVVTDASEGTSGDRVIQSLCEQTAPDLDGQSLLRTIRQHVSDRVAQAGARDSTT
ncbi:MAG: SpoIIE family protein phosphatase, partial [Myxococcota bacterium]